MLKLVRKSLESRVKRGDLRVQDPGLVKAWELHCWVRGFCCFEAARHYMEAGGCRVALPRHHSEGIAILLPSMRKKVTSFGF